MDEQNTALSRRRFLSVAGAGLAAVSGLASPLAHVDALAAALAQDHEEAKAAAHHFSVLGHDLSTLQQEEAIGHTFSDGGKVLPVERIVKKHGATHVRLRLWVDPPIPFNDLPHVLTMAKRVKAAGLKLLLDFHYSDFWADPGKQPTPQRWKDQDVPTLAQTVHDYTASVLQALAQQGTPPQMVQIGNEITDGMLWPQGMIYPDKTTQRWDEFTTLLKAGIAGAHDGSPAGHTPRIMVHIDRGGDNPGSIYFYDHILAKGVQFDVIGLSFYPWWHGPPTSLAANLNDLSTRYKKDLVVVETAYPWTLKDGDGYPNNVGPSDFLYATQPPTPKGQLSYLHQILSILRKVPGGRGHGLVYWEPAWIPGVGWEPGAGDAWDNLTLFDFTGKALPSIKAYEGANKKKAAW